MIFCGITNYAIKYVDLIQKSGTVIVMAAFGAHFLKKITRTELLSAAKRQMPQDKKTLNTLEKNDLEKYLLRMVLKKRCKHRRFIT